MNTAHAIASAKVRKFASPHRSSGRNSASAARSLIIVSIGNLACSCVSPLPDNLRGGLSPPPSKGPAGFRPPPRRRSCERLNSQPRRYQPWEFLHCVLQAILLLQDMFHGFWLSCYIL